jgi:phosphatidate cytidylyltransferase
MLWEFGRMVNRLAVSPFPPWGLLILTLWESAGPWLQFFFPGQWIFFYVVGTFLFLFMLCLFGACTLSGSGDLLKDWWERFAAHFFGFFYLGILPLHLIWIHELPGGKKWLLLFFAMHWLTDSGAYLVGSKWGRRRLFAHVSPNKTWEGAIAGTCCGALVAIGAWAQGGVESRAGAESWLFYGVTAGMVIVSAQVGDLCESLLKRAFKLKDSGALLPGHGGLLDRFDGVVFSAPFMYVGVRLMLEFPVELPH